MSQARTNGGARPRPFAQLGWAMALPACLFWGCPPPTDIVTDEKLIECRAELRGYTPIDAEGITEPVISQSVTNSTRGFEASYWNGTDCPADMGGDGWEADWPRRLREGVEARKAEEDSIFSLSNEWCVVPDSIVCVETDEEKGLCETETSAQAEPLEICSGEFVEVTPTPPTATPTGGLSLTCGAEACQEENGRIVMDFGTVGPTETRERDVVVRNGGPTTAEIVLDGTIVPITPFADFEVPLETNTCHPSAGDGNRLAIAPGADCRFLVRFAPQVDGEHRGELQLTAGGVTTFELEGVAGSP